MRVVVAPQLRTRLVELDRLDPTLVTRVELAIDLLAAGVSARELARRGVRLRSARFDELPGRAYYSVRGRFLVIRRFDDRIEVLDLL
ncbi:MAG: hypothetical protein AB7O92_23975 [Acidimicrobiia bacterium]